ncbi:MerR family transcriptional regulator [Sporocytophaga myxococcoides]|uniref:MerR family transcriptional regulator n=1 Tax=Sporocytophaga myxococcoides TaxID=153721 RepID=UPI0004154607|nr:MerR family transcriptional regulator [Sporocytophaga myxococcoides]
MFGKKVYSIMLIGEISLKTGLSRDTIRYYEKIGLIKINKRQRRDNNYKEYSAEIIERLEIIKRAKYLGFSLQEIKELIDAWANKTLTIDERIELFESRIALLDEKILRLNEVKSLIRKRIKQIKEDGK